MKKINVAQFLVQIQLCLFFSILIFILNPLITLSLQNIDDIKFSMVYLFGDILLLSSFAFFETLCAAVIFTKFVGYSATCNLLIFLSIYILLCSINPVSAQATANMNGLNFKIDVIRLF